MGDTKKPPSRQKPLHSPARSKSTGASRSGTTGIKDLRSVLYKKFRSFPLFSRRRSKSIVDKMMSLLLLWGLVIYLLAIAGVWLGSTKVIEDNFSRQAADWIKKLDELGTPLYTGNVQESFSSIENHVSRFPEVSYLRYYDNKNKDVIAEYKSDDLLETQIDHPDADSFAAAQNKTAKGSPLFIQTADTDLSLIQVLSPIVIRSIQSEDMMNFDLESEQKESTKIIGYIEVGLDFSQYRQQLVDNLVLLSLGFGATFILAAIYGRIVIRRALKSLINLRKPLKKLAKGNINVSFDSDSDGDEEIVAISSALNTTIAALKNRDHELQQLANYDSLTGLLNKFNFNIKLKEEIERITAENDSSALLFIDLDQFKHVNDNLGHAAGDRLLVQVADLLKSRIREEDVLSRFGGDEFTIIAKSVNATEAKKIADSIVKSMHDFVFIEGNKSYNIFCSIGLAMIDPDGSTADEMFSQADMACFQAKSKGRNCYHMYDVIEQEQNRIETDFGWAKRIKDSMTDGSLSLYYQPIVSLMDEGVEHYEALLRMHSDNGEVLLPGAFLSAAERLGLAVEIDYWVIRNAFEQVKQFNEQGKTINLAVNLSGRVFEAPNLVKEVRKLLKQSNINPEDIVFEVTEQTAVRQLDRARRRINELMKLGFRFALDDFGVGFSSFNYLKKLPVEYLKIDGSFVVGMTEDPVDQAMIKAMIQIANILDKKIVAEHVEDKATLEMLKEFGADYAQGFFVGEPMPECRYEKYEAVLSHTASNVVKLKS